MHALLFALILGGCGDPYEDTKKVDTIEAWQQYLATKPSGSRLLGAQDRLEELMTKKAEASELTADYDAVLKQFPTSKQKKKLQEARTKIALAAAEAANTPAGWDVFVKENPWADGAIVKRAKSRIAVAEYLPSLGMTEPAVVEANLAEDPKGEKDGWDFSVTVTNNGTKTIESMKVEAHLLDPADSPYAKTCPETLVGAAFVNRQATPEEIAKALAPGESRLWSCMLAKTDIPEGWAQKVRVVPVSISFAATP